jgi:hypothetical protein
MDPWMRNSIDPLLGIAAVPFGLERMKRKKNPGRVVYLVRIKARFQSNPVIGIYVKR